MITFCNVCVAEINICFWDSILVRRLERRRIGHCVLGATLLCNLPSVAAEGALYLKKNCKSSLYLTKTYLDMSGRAASNSLSYNNCKLAKAVSL